MGRGHGEMVVKGYKVAVMHNLRSSMVTIVNNTVTIVKTCKQPKCPSKEEWIKKMWYIYIQWNTTQP